VRALAQNQFDHFDCVVVLALILGNDKVLSEDAFPDIGKSSLGVCFNSCERGII